MKVIMVMLVGNMPLDYVPKEKERVGWRRWMHAHTPHPPDPRHCAVYTQTEYEKQLASISACHLVVEDAETCQATAGCSWKPIFQSGKCIGTPKIAFPWQRGASAIVADCDLLHPTTTTSTASVSTITDTLTHTTTVTTGTQTISTTRSSTMSSATTTSTVTMSITTSATSQTATVTSTVTSTTLTTSTITSTLLPGSCPVPNLGDSVDASDCVDKFPGETCQVLCATGNLGDPSTFSCSQQEIFTGEAPTCTPTTTWTTATTTQTQLVFCSGGLPTGPGVDVSDCLGKVNGQTCTVSCVATYQGEDAEYVCNPTEARFAGPEVTCSKITCSADQLPAGYDTSACAETAAGEICIVSCLPGFAPASAAFLCGSDGTFSGTAPTCVAVSCPADELPVAPGLDTEACVGASAGDTCLVSCAVGYRGVGSTFECLNDGSFAGVTPNCERRTCDLPSEFQTEMVSSTCAGAMHNDQCVAICNQGYEGLPTKQTCWNGTFLGVVPSCFPRECSIQGTRLETGLDATDCLGKKVGDTCLLQCSPGYDLVGSGVLQCLSTGLFNESQATCVPGTCGTLSDVPPFAPHFIGDSCSVMRTGQVCTAFCEPGYDIVGNASVLLCDGAPADSAGFTEVVPGSSLSWPAVESPGPTCMIRTCTGAPDSPLLTHNCSAAKTGETCIVQAVLPYQLEGASSVELVCESSGFFSGTLPPVVPAVCPQPSFASGIGSTCANRSVGADCWAYCLKDWVGAARRYECQFDAASSTVEIQATGEAIACELNSSAARRLAATNPCSADSASAAGLAELQYTHSCGDQQHDEVCLAHCSMGFTMTEETPAILVCDNGAFVGAAMPTCTGQPCNNSLPQGAGVSHNCDGTTAFGTCDATCGQAGYTYTAGSQKEIFTCMPWGSFQGNQPSCEPISCQDLVLDGIYSHNCKSKRFGDTCGVSCATGYHLSGWGSQYVCGADGTFEGVLPQCNGNPCQNTVDDPALDASACNSLTTGEDCNVTCQAGYGFNQTTVVCGASGFLSGILPICSPLPCVADPELQHPTLAHSCNSVPFGQSCVVFCANGYVFSNGSSAETWQCRLNATSGATSLEGLVPSCEAELCSSGLPASSPRVSDNCTGIRTGEACERTCAHGFSGEDVVYVCTSDGAATSNSSSACSPLSCNFSAAPENVIHTCSGIVFGGGCSAFCAPGYGDANGSSVQSWSCEGAESGLELIPGQSTSDVGLRGTVPSCVPLGCFYNFPSGAQYQHDCDGVVTGGSCNVSCAEGWEGPSSVLRCSADGGLVGAFPACSFLVVTETVTSTTVSTMTTTNTDILFEIRVAVAGRFIVAVNNSQDFMSDANVTEAFATVLATLIPIDPTRLAVSFTAARRLQDYGLLAESRSRRLAEQVQVSYQTWIMGRTQEEADSLGLNISSGMNFTSLAALGDLLLAELGSEKGLYYALDVRSHNVDITVGSRIQEVVAKAKVDETCPVVNLPAISGAGPFDCQEPKFVGQSCNATCSSQEIVSASCLSDGTWLLASDCVPLSDDPVQAGIDPLLIVVLGSALALCCLVTVCGILCARRTTEKTVPEPEVKEEAPPLPLPLPSILELPKQDDFDTSFWNWAERWEQSRPKSGGVDIPLVPPPSLPGAVEFRKSGSSDSLERRPSLPTPPARPPPSPKRGMTLPPPVPPMRRRALSPAAPGSPVGSHLVVQVKPAASEDQLRVCASEFDAAPMDMLEDVVEEEERFMLNIGRMDGSMLAKMQVRSHQTVGELVESLKQAGDLGMDLVLARETKVLRPDQRLDDCGLYDGSQVIAVRHPELFVAGAYDDGMVAVWSVESGVCERTFECRYGAVKSVALAQSGLVLVLGMVDGTVQLWNVVTGQLMRQYSGHMGAIFSVAASPNGKMIATGCFDGTARIIVLESGKIVRVCSGHRGSIMSLAFSADSRTVATGSEDSMVKLWKVQERSGELTLSGHTGTVTAIAFSTHSKAVATGCDNGEVHAWSVVSGRLVWELPRAHALVKTLGFSRDGVSLAVGCANGDCLLYSADTRSCASKVQCDMAGSIRCMGFSPASKLLICGGEVGVLQVFGSEDGSCKKILELEASALGQTGTLSAVAVCAGPTPGKKARGRHRPENTQLELHDAERAALPAV
ncbi:HET-E1 [Symbiodinium sp. CCMP2592]|nr:HET-E1 [Symbiodinium sp. CCMP2592]